MTNEETNLKKIDTVESAKRAKGYYGEDTKEARIAYSSFLDGCEWKDKQHSVAYVVTSCEEHGDYVEEAFFDIEKAEQYCAKYNSNEDNYQRHITKVNVTL